MQPQGSNIFYYVITKFNSGASISSILMVNIAVIIEFAHSIAVFASTVIFTAFLAHVTF